MGKVDNKNIRKSNNLVEKAKSSMSVDSTCELEDMKRQIDNEIQRIVTELGLETSDDVMIQLKNCCLLQKYMVEHIEYLPELMGEKKQYADEMLRIMDLYHAVIQHNGVCTSNSVMFQEVLGRVSVPVECVVLMSQDNTVHMANLVKLDGDYYFFDSTLEKSIYDEHAKEGHSLILCCAGLGKQEYCPFYTPIGIMPKNPLDDIMPVPTNISNVQIPNSIVNGLIYPTDHKKL